MQRITVPMADGDEQMWIYAASPSGAGPFPVVVFGHGQGVTNLLNCAPARPPDDVDVASSQGIADGFAAAGYVAVAIYYRNRGDTAPGVGVIRPRDHYLRDARAFLAAAHWASDEHGLGSSQVALLGSSMGSFPAIWATAPFPELADLQDGLDIRTVIPSAMLGNHIANTGRNAYLLEVSDPSVRSGAIALAAFAAVSYRATAAGIRQIESTTLDDPAIGSGLTAAGTELFADVFLRAPRPSLAGCSDLIDVPAGCADTCFASTFADTAARLGIASVEPADWLSADTLAGLRYWDPPLAVDPGAETSNVLLAAERIQSPAYALQGPLVTPRLLPLVSIGDDAVTAQLEGGNNQAAEIYLERLRGTGAQIPDPVPIVQDASCGHGDYHDPERPECGWSLVLAELAAAFP